MVATQLVAIHLVLVGAVGGIIHVPADFPTIQSAIDEAHAFDTIIVAPGTYSETIGFHGKVITVQSTNPNDPSIVAATTIDAGGLGPAVTFSGGEDEVNTILDGFTITGGTIGIDAHRSLANIRHCVIRNNIRFGISQADGDIEDTQIINNSIGRIGLGDVGLLDCDGTIRRSLIRNNSGSALQDCDGTISDSRIELMRGDGVAGGNITILRCIIASNTGDGVTYSNNPGTTFHTGAIEKSLIVGNRFGINGGNFGDGGIVRNSVVAGNRESGLFKSRKDVFSCTITGNRAYGLQSHNGTISHVIFWDNVFGPFIEVASKPLYSGNANPYFVSPGYWDFLNELWVDGDYHLTPDSPYIDAGDPGYTNNPHAPVSDFDGKPRIHGSRVDIGAFEFHVPCEGDDFDGDGTPDVCDRDIDDDGIQNGDDRCDDTPHGIPVDIAGRPTADLNHDCTVDLLDFGIFQESIIGP